MDGYDSRKRVQSARKHATLHVFHKDSENRFMGSDRNEKDVSKTISFKRSLAPKPLDRFDDLSAFCTKRCMRDTKINVTIKYLLINRSNVP